MLIDTEMEWIAEPQGKMGRPAVFSYEAIQLCLAIKVLFNLLLPRHGAGNVDAGGTGLAGAGVRRRWPSRSRIGEAR